MSKILRVDDAELASTNERPSPFRLKPLSLGARRSKPDLTGVMPNAIFVESNVYILTSIENGPPQVVYVP